MGEGERGKLELEIPRGLQEFSLYPNTSAVLETPRKYPKPQKTVSVILPVYRTKRAGGRSDWFIQTAGNQTTDCTTEKKQPRY